MKKTHKLIPGFPAVKKNTANLKKAPVNNLDKEALERKKAQERARLSAETYRDLGENVNDLIQSVAPDGSFIYVNRSWRETLGYNDDEISGLRLPDIIHPDSKAHCNQIFQRLMNREKIERFEAIFLSKDGRAITVEGSANCRFVNDKPVATRAIFRDITERKKAEEALRKAKDELERRVQQRTIELRTAIEQLQQEIEERKKTEETLQKAYSKLKETQSQLIQVEKMEVVGRLASGVAHEVKNPLATLFQWVEHLEREAQAGDKNFALALGHMKDAIKKANSVVEGLLDFSSLAKLDTESGDLNSLIESSLLLIKYQLDKHHIEVVKYLAEGIPRVKIDKNRIEQVFINLFMNAVHAMPGGGRLTVKTYAGKACELDEGLYRREKNIFQPEDAVVVAEVQDSGAGIPEDALDKIFDPFFTTRREAGGSGLGLSVARNIIEMHNAAIEIQNKKEGGSGARAALIFKS